MVKKCVFEKASKALNKDNPWDISSIVSKQTEKLIEVFGEEPKIVSINLCGAEALRLHYGFLSHRGIITHIYNLQVIVNPLQKAVVLVLMDNHLELMYSDKLHEIRKELGLV